MDGPITLFMNGAMPNRKIEMDGLRPGRPTIDQSTDEDRGPTRPATPLAGYQFLPNLPDGAGHLVGMCINRGRVYVASEFGVFVVNDQDQLEQLNFAPDVLAGPDPLR